MIRGTVHRHQVVAASVEQMTTRLSDAVTATVPVDWLHLFIGHRVWSKPEDFGYSTYGYYVLVDVVHEPT